MAVGAGLTSACTGDADRSRRDAGGGSTAASSAAATLVPRCPSPPARRLATSADQLNTGVAKADLPGWQAADIGASARLSDGRIVWLFGDTVREPSYDPRLVANSMLVSSGPCVSQLTTPAKGPVIPDAKNGAVRWPMSVVVGRSKGQEVLVVLCARMDRGHSGNLGFVYLGSSAAVFSVGPGQPPALRKVLDITPDSRDPQQVNWGAAATRDGSWYYVFGTRLTGVPLQLGRELYVARLPVSDPGTRDRWRFWAGHGWQADPRSARPVLDADHGVSQTLSVDVVGHRFVAISKLGGDVADFVYEWTAPDAWGPWHLRKELPAPGGFDTGKYKYAPLAHPEVRLRSGKLLVSVSRNTSDLQRLLDHPQVGRPYFAEVDRG